MLQSIHIKEFTAGYKKMPYKENNLLKIFERRDRFTKV